MPTDPALILARVMAAIVRLVREENWRRRENGAAPIPEPRELGNPDTALSYTASVLGLLPPVSDLRSNVLFLEAYARNNARHFEKAWSLVLAVQVMES